MHIQDSEDGITLIVPANLPFEVVCTIKAKKSPPIVWTLGDPVEWRKKHVYPTQTDSSDQPETNAHNCTCDTQQSPPESSVAAQADTH